MKKHELRKIVISAILKASNIDVSFLSNVSDETFSAVNYATCDYEGRVEFWRHKPKYDERLSQYRVTDNTLPIFYANIPSPPSPGAGVLVDLDGIMVDRLDKVVERMFAVFSGVAPDPHLVYDHMEQYSTPVGKVKEAEEAEEVGEKPSGFLIELLMDKDFEFNGHSQVQLPKMSIEKAYNLLNHLQVAFDDTGKNYDLCLLLHPAEPPTAVCGEIVIKDFWDQDEHEFGHLDKILLHIGE